MGERCRSQSLHGTAAAKSREKRREQSCAEGREAGRWRREFHNGEQSEAPAVPERATQGAETQPRLVVSGSFGVERAHVGGAR